LTDPPKITFIGAGSVEFTRVLVGDLPAYPELRAATLSLPDIDDERLATAPAASQGRAVPAPRILPNGVQ
jgi:alpha-galactosidase